MSVLNKAKLTLKNEFAGIDDVIDEVIHLIEPWFLFPESQFKPNIINLWGMTGVGKTALVTRLVELLDFQNSFVRFDIGEYLDKRRDLKVTLTDDLQKLQVFY